RARCRLRRWRSCACVRRARRLRRALSPRDSGSPRRGARASATAHAAHALARFVGVRSAWPQGGAANSRLRRWGAARAIAPGARGRRRRFTRRTGAARERRQMSDLLPDTERILMGPGPSLTSPRVMRAMAAPTVSHLDPGMIALLDDTRVRLARLFR